MKQSERLANIPSPIFAITGGIATGKSTVSQLIKKEGHPLLCADELVKKIYQEEKTISFISSHFPVVFENEKIDFKKLRELFFSDANIQEKIESFLYPKLESLLVKEFEALGSPAYLFYDVPLLFEKKLESLVDLKILVYAPRETQIERLMKRSKLSRDSAIKILDHQWDIERKKGLCDFIINNQGSESELPLLVKSVLHQIFD